MLLSERKKKFAAGFVIFVTIVMIWAAIANLVYYNTNQPGAQVTTPLYTVKTSGNQIGVYKGKSDSPEYYIEGVRPAGLPELDREMLKVGIEVYTEEDLIKLLQDLDG